MARVDELRMIAKVARMYYIQRMRQSEIVERLGIHQSTVSRLLKRAESEGIVRISVAPPAGIHSELEEALETRFGLKEVLIVDCLENEEQIAQNLGAAAAFFVESNVSENETIGISSWSATLLAMVIAMHPTAKGAGTSVVQMLGGVGNPNTQIDATQLTQRLASLIGGRPVLLPAPGVVGSPEARDILLKDQFVEEAVSLFRSLSIALVGVGALEPSKGLASSGNIFSPQELKSLKAQGAVGDICLRFFDANGVSVPTPLNERVIGIELRHLKRAKRVVGVAGGIRKRAAILGALRGKWVNVLITDRGTADFLAGAALKRTTGKTA
jgi:DNA-binding transcriptional regulator LsrR (DeoR family)